MDNRPNTSQRHRMQTRSAISASPTTSEGPVFPHNLSASPDLTRGRRSPLPETFEDYESEDDASSDNELTDENPKKGSPLQPESRSPNGVKHILRNKPECRPPYEVRSTWKHNTDSNSPDAVSYTWKYNPVSSSPDGVNYTWKHNTDGSSLDGIKHAKKYNPGSNSPDGVKNTLKSKLDSISPDGLNSTLTCKPASTSFDESTASRKPYFILISIIGLVVIMLCCTLGSNDKVDLQELKLQLVQLREDVREIRKQFPMQEDNLWPTLLAGIKKVEEEDPSQPSTFLLLHEVEEDETPKCLAMKMSKVVTAFLKAADPSPLKLRGEELGANDSLIKDHGVLISEQKESVTNHRAVIIFNLHKIPATVAQTFHYFCDEYNPVVQKAVYFFTMNVAKKFHSKNSPTFVAESELKNLWQQQLENDKLQPLIVRLTTSVMMIKPEKGLTSCES